MKKAFCLFLAFCLLAASLCSTSLGESETWTCSSCGKASSGNFCSNCGAKKPEAINDDSAIAPESIPSESVPSESVPVSVHVNFDENAVFSTYDVEMYIDGVLLTKMPHGKNYDGTIETSVGKHTVSFFKSGSSKVTGTCIIDVAGPASFSCNIHANSDKVTVTKVKLTAGEEQKAMNVNGQNELDLTIDFRRNAAFSTYDVDLYCDGTFITTMPHGEGFHGILKVSQGIHTLQFYDHDDQSKTGKSEFSVNGNTRFSCRIEATRKGVEVSDEKLNDSDSKSLVSKSDYINACISVQYKSVERNPEQYKGEKIKVSGQVIQVIENGSNAATLRISEANDSVWYVTYKRSDNEPRVLEDDHVTVYGECSGIVTYTTILGSSVTIPGMNAAYIDIK